MIIKCKICGGDMEISVDKTFGTCEYCGSTMTLPKVDDEQRAAQFNRGNHFRRSGEFDKALALYEHIVAENDADAEAHWCCALCRFGIEYVEDPATMEYIPTCHRASFDSFLDDVDYLAAVEHSDGLTKRQYQKDAARIAEVQRGILATSQNEEPFDVFICYKESDEAGQRTKDSALAQDIYYQLTEAGYRVFFSRITLEEKAGTEYEPYIFAALNSAKVMVAVGTKPEYYNAVWVKNEWSRFLALMRKDRSKLLLPCYRDMDPYDLPEQLSVLQSYDMGKIGFVQDLIRGIKKVIVKDEPKETVRETVAVNTGNANTAPLLERVFIFLEDGKWQDANIYCEKILDIDPKNAEAYLGKLMAELQVTNRKKLADCAEPFDDRDNYNKILRFGDEAIEAEVRGYITHINERNENARLKEIYDNAQCTMHNAQSEETYQQAAEIFTSISGFKDADAMARRCVEKAEKYRKDGIYNRAVYDTESYSVSGQERAIQLFEQIIDWKDSRDKIEQCKKKIEEIKAKEETARIAAEKAKKKRKITLSITLPTLSAVIIFVIVLFTVIIPNSKYNAAIALKDEGKYKEAIAAFEALDGYKNSKAMISKCQTALKDIKYDTAVALMNDGKYEEAIAAFEALNGYKDSATKASEILSQYEIEKMKIADIGEVVYFGAYEQDNNTLNGKEDVEWIVLAKENEKALVISKYALDCQQYNSTDTDVTWENCSLRKWMNGTFLNNAFSAEEQAKIATTNVSADKNPEYSTNPGNVTTDKVFLLSITEAEKYFTTDESRKCAPTAYAKAQGAWTSDRYKTASGEATCLWWLRSPGYYQDIAASVNYGGSVDCFGDFVNSAYVCVRPAMWINLEQ